MEFERDFSKDHSEPGFGPWWAWVLIYLLIVISGFYY